MPQGRRLHFRFADLDIEDNNCQVNYLRIYDGVGPQRTQIGERGMEMEGLGNGSIIS